MELSREHEFTVGLSENEVWKCALLAEAEISGDEPNLKGRLAWADVEAEGSNEVEVLQGLIGELGQKIGGPEDPFFGTFKGYLTTNGRALTESEIRDGHIEQLQGRGFRVVLGDDEQYDVKLLEDLIAVFDDESGLVTLTVPWADTSFTADNLQNAYQGLEAKLDELIGENDSPGSLWEAHADFARQYGERIPPEQLAAEKEAAEAYEKAKGSIEEITPADIDAMSHGATPLLIDFWAPWCGPCKAVTPVLAQLQTEWEGKMRFAKINCDDHSDAYETYGFRGIPTMIVFHNGEEKHRVTGFGGRDALVKELEPLLG